MTVWRGVAACVVMLAAAAAPAWAQAPNPSTSTSAGPGRITCKSATACTLGVGTPAKLQYRIDASALPDADRARLLQGCTAKGAPCVVTVLGAEDARDPLKVKAAKITWHN